METTDWGQGKTQKHKGDHRGGGRDGSAQEECDESNSFKQNVFHHCTNSVITEA